VTQSRIASFIASLACENLRSLAQLPMATLADAYDKRSFFLAFDIICAHINDTFSPKRCDSAVGHHGISTGFRDTFYHTFSEQRLTRSLFALCAPGMI
jgi:hypothetical protein